MALGLGWASEQPRTAALYVSFLVGCIITYQALQARESGAYDYLLTLSAALQALAFALLVIGTRSSVAEGLSEKTLWAFIVAHVTRLSTTFWGEGYVPEDNTSDVYLYQLLELVGVLFLVFHMLKVSALRTVHDVGQGLERWSLLLAMGGVSIVLAWATKSTGHNDYFADLSWMFAVWLEAFALAPQVWLLSSTSNVDESQAHFAGLTLAASTTFALFWTRMAREKFAEFQKAGEHGFFFGILLAAFIRIVLCSVYLYLFLRSTGALPAKGRSTGRHEYELCNQDEL